MNYRYVLFANLIISALLINAAHEGNGEQLCTLQRLIKEGKGAELLDTDFKDVSPYDLERFQQFVGCRQKALTLVRWMHDERVMTYWTEMKVKIARNRQIGSELYDIASDVKEPVNSRVEKTEPIASKLSEIEERARSRKIRNNITPEEAFVQDEKNRQAALWFWQREKEYEHALELLTASQRSHIWEHVTEIQQKTAHVRKSISLTQAYLDDEENSLHEMATMIDEKLTRDWKKVCRDVSLTDDDELRPLVCTYVKKTEEEKQAIGCSCAIL